MSDGHLVAEETLTLPYGTLRTLHNGVSEVRVYRNLITQTRQVGKRVSLFGREDTLAVNEAAFLREIDHPNVAKVFEVAEVLGYDPALSTVEIIMPFYEQGSVLDALAKQHRRFSVGEARDIAVRALRGLAHLHDEHRILHRDNKPGNLYLAADASRVKVGDFGEAMRMDQDRTAEPLLSPQLWTPPETFCGSRHTVCSELYSMGMSLHELLSGPFPYEEYHVEQLAERLGEGRCAVMPRHLRFQPHVPDDLRRVVRKATRQRPDRRYQTAQEMIDALLRARLIDWSWPEEGKDEVVWRGQGETREYRVVAMPVRGKGWRARCEQPSSGGWRKVGGTQVCDAPNPYSAAERLFRQIDRQLVRV